MQDTCQLSAQTIISYDIKSQISYYHMFILSHNYWNGVVESRYMCVVKKEASCFSLSKNGHAKNYNTIETYATNF